MLELVFLFPSTIYMMMKTNWDHFRDIKGSTESRPHNNNTLSTRLTAPVGIQSEQPKYVLEKKGTTFVKRGPKYGYKRVLEDFCLKTTCIFFMNHEKLVKLEVHNIFYQTSHPHYPSKAFGTFSGI